MKLGLVLAAFLVAATPAFAVEDWNGTWSGNWQSADNNGIQLVMAGNTVEGVFWNGAYELQNLQSSVSADGTTLTVTWGKSKATIVRETNTTARMTIEEPGKPATSFAVALDS